jgi:lipopolysaccharide export system protein LptC
MTASRAVQRSSDTPLVDINGLYATLNMEQGPLLIAANQGRYNLDTQQVDVLGPINVTGGDGWRLLTRDVTVDLKQSQLASRGPAEGQMRLGQFRANRIRADLGTHTVVLDGGARLKIVQGAVR